MGHLEAEDLMEKFSSNISKIEEILRIARRRAIVRALYFSLCATLALHIVIRSFGVDTRISRAAFVSALAIMGFGSFLLFTLMALKRYGHDYARALASVERGKSVRERTS